MNINIAVNIELEAEDIDVGEDLAVKKIMNSIQPPPMMVCRQLYRDALERFQVQNGRERRSQPPDAGSVPEEDGRARHKHGKRG